jgi:hypothetical protein
MKAAIIVLVLALASVHASVNTTAPKPTGLGINASCMADLIGLAGPVTELFTDVKAVLGGDVTKIEEIYSDIEGIITAGKKALTDCGIAESLQLNAGCLADIEAIAGIATALASDVASLVKGDFSKIGDVITQAKAIVAEIPKLKADC